MSANPADYHIIGIGTHLDIDSVKNVSASDRSLLNEVINAILKLSYYYRRQEVIVFHHRQTSHKNLNKELDKLKELEKDYLNIVKFDHSDRSKNPRSFVKMLQNRIRESYVNKIP